MPLAKIVFRIRRSQEYHVPFRAFWQERMPTTEVAYRLGLSKAQMASHLANVVDAVLARLKPSYEIVLEAYQPRAVIRPYLADPLFKGELADELMLTPCSPEDVKKSKDKQVVEVDTVTGGNLAGFDVTAEGQD